MVTVVVTALHLLPFIHSGLLFLLLWLVCRGVDHLDGFIRLFALLLRYRRLVLKVNLFRLGT